MSKERALEDRKIAIQYFGVRSRYGGAKVLEREEKREEDREGKVLIPREIELLHMDLQGCAADDLGPDSWMPV